MERTTIHRLFLVLNNRLLTDGLALLLGPEANVEVVGSASAFPEALRLIPVLEPHLVVLDGSTLGEEGSSRIHLLRQHFPETKVLLLLSRTELPLPEPDLVHATNARVLKELGFEELLLAIRATAGGGGLYLSDGIAGSSNGHSAEAPITSREQEVLTLIAKGYSGKAIAEHLFISVNTVKYHRKNLLGKAGAHNTVQLLDWGRKHRVVR